MNRGELKWWLLAVGGAGLLGLALGSGSERLMRWGEVVAIATILTAGVVLLANRLATDRDRPWIAAVVLVAYGAKLIGALLRWAMVAILYGHGDSMGYHAAGSAVVQTWRSLTVPSASGGSRGTQFVGQVTGLLYAPYVPSLLGGFLIFATVSFLGQVLFYAAARHWAADQRQLRIYAGAVFFLPTLLFWPSSIGKEALMVFFLGLFSLGAARIFEKYRFRDAVLAVGGAAGTAAIRPHVTTLLAGAAAAAIVLSRPPRSLAIRSRRVLLVAGAALAVSLVVGFTSGVLGINPEDEEDVDAFVSRQHRLTMQGGSAVDEEAISSPADFPGAALRVLFRPLPSEAHNLPALLNSLESVALLGILLWRAVPMARSLKSIRRKPFMVFALFYTAGFVIGFSVILNLGILARQRTQVYPLLAALVVGLGWPVREAEEDDQSEPVSQDIARGLPVGDRSH